MEDDFLDEIIAESTKRNPEFPKLIEAAQERRRQARKAAAEEDGAEGATVIGTERPEDENE